MKTKREIIAAASFSVLIGVLSACSASAADKEFVVHAMNNVTGDDALALQLTYELQNIDGSVVSSKTSSEQDIVFDPIILDDADNTSHFYKIVQKNGAIDGVSYDGKIVYVRIVPQQNLLAYQDDTTYKYKNDGTGPHPYNATDEELQGQAYAVYDTETKVLTFFRDEAGKYSDYQTDGTKIYYTDFELQNAGRISTYGAARPSWMNATVGEAKKVVFQDAIRPEGPAPYWFSQFEELEEADFSKFDTSRVTALYSFLYQTPKLQDVDITHFDFSRIASVIADSESSLGSSALASFMSYSKLKEFDSTNYAKLTTNGGSTRVNDHMFSVSDLRFLDATNFDFDSGSGEFNSTSCLERVVVGPNYNFLRASMGNDWLKIETGEVGNFHTFMTRDETGATDFFEPNPLAAGNYVRPTCNTTPATFSAKYVKPIAPVTPAEDEIDNPNTSDDIAKNYLILITAAALLVLVVTAKMKGEIK